MVTWQAAIILGAAVLGLGCALGWQANGSWRRGRVEQRAAFSMAADWLAQCLHCGHEHTYRSDPPYQGTWADPDDGHAYQPRDIGTAEQLRQAADDEEAWT